MSLSINEKYVKEDKHIAMIEYSTTCERPRLESQSSIVDGLLSEIYDRWHDHRHDSFDSDTFTECSSTSEFVHWRRNSLYHDLEIGGRHLGYLHRAMLQEYKETELKNMVCELSRRVNQMSARLVRQLKRRERRMSKMQTNCDIITAIIQASSPKRRIDTRMRFTVEPSMGDDAFEQWKDAMKAVARLPLGIPDEFRKKVWLSLADQHIRELKIDWEKTVRFAFNERSNPDDNKLGLQIVKDLHRTGCTGFSGEENEEERALLKRILLAYARWNKAVGYCQGFNVIAALLLDVMDRKEADALKVMIYLIDHVLPQSYFANNLRALSVDMAVFRDLLKIFPKLSKHLDYLQHAQDQVSGGCYEPPLTNVFTMQWFLTLFATCLPKSTVLRVWDSILLDGSEILLRTALVIWGKLSNRILTVSSADEFYTLMGDITQEMLEGNILDADSMIKSIYSIAPFPFPQLGELREKYTYNIRPFTPANKKAAWGEGGAVPSDEDDLEDEEIEAITCFTGFIPTTGSTGVLRKGIDSDQKSGSLPDISSLGPGAYGLGPSDSGGAPNVPAYMERMTTDISALKKQYAKLRQRQTQAHIILTTASARKQAPKSRPIMPTIETPTAVNHLFLAKTSMKGRNRYVAAGPRIANMYPITSPLGANRAQHTVQPQAKSEATSVRNQKPWKTGQYQVTQPHKQSISSKQVGNAVISPAHAIAHHTDLPTQTDHAEPSPDNPSLSGDEANQSVEQSCEKTNPALHKSEMAQLSGPSSFAMAVTADVLNKVEGEPVDCNDSGLGNSISSPSYSLSLTDCSPQHVNQVTGTHANTDIAEGEVQKHFAEVKLDTFYKETADVWNEGTDEVEAESDSVKGDDVVIVDRGDGKVHKSDNSDECGAEVSGMMDSVQENREIKGNANEDCMSEIKHESAEQTRHVIDNPTEADSSETEGKDEEFKESVSKVSDVLAVKSISSAKSTGDNHTQASRPVKSFSSGDADISVKVSSSARQVQKPQKALSEDRRSRTISGASVTSGSGSDCENLPDVFGLDTPKTSHSQSFQQYYATKRNLSVDSGSLLSNSAKSNTCMTRKSFNPFPVKHLNQNRAKTGLKLGLYKQSTLEEYERNLKNQPSVWTK